MSTVFTSFSQTPSYFTHIPQLPLKVMASYFLIAIISYMCVYASTYRHTQTVESHMCVCLEMATWG